MSAFTVSAGDYLRAADIASEKNKEHPLLPIVLACRERAHDAWDAFAHTIFADRGRRTFESVDHCVLALCLMAAICLDEEREEEGQL